jgi:hypothetical protein
MLPYTLPAQRLLLWSDPWKANTVLPLCALRATTLSLIVLWDFA